MTYQESTIGKFTCDVPWCKAVSPGALGQAAARDSGNGAGWSIGPGMSICPKHAPLMAAEVTAEAKDAL